MKIERLSLFFGISFFFLEILICFYMYHKYILIHNEVNSLIELRNDYRNILEKVEETLIKKKILF